MKKDLSETGSSFKGSFTLAVLELRSTILKIKFGTGFSGTNFSTKGKEIPKENVVVLWRTWLILT